MRYECPFCWSEAEVCAKQGPCCGECVKEAGRGGDVHDTDWLTLAGGTRR
jgi:hypothetical protein